MILTKKIQRNFTLANDALHIWLRDHWGKAHADGGTVITSTAGLELLVHKSPITRFPGLNRSTRWHGPWLFTRFLSPSDAHLIGFDCNPHSGKWNYSETEDILWQEWLLACIERLGKRVLGVSWEEIDFAQSIIDDAYLWPRNYTTVSTFAKFMAAWRLSEKYTTAKLRQETLLCRTQGTLAARNGDELAMRNMQVLESIRQNAVMLRESDIDIHGKWTQK